MSCSCNKTVPETGEIAELKAQLEAAQKAAGEMRKALKDITIQGCLCSHPDGCVCCLEESSVQTIAQECLDSTDCGRDYVPKAEVDRLKEQAERQAKVIDEQRGLYHEMTNTVDRAVKERDEARAVLLSLVKLVKGLSLVVPEKPQAITWEQGVFILNKVQDEFLPEALDRAKEIL